MVSSDVCGVREGSQRVFRTGSRLNVKLKRDASVNWVWRETEAVVEFLVIYCSRFAVGSQSMLT